MRILLYWYKLGVKKYVLGENLLEVFNEWYEEIVDNTKDSKLFTCRNGLYDCYWKNVDWGSEVVV